MIAQRQVGTAFRSASCLACDDIDGARGFLTLDVVFGPALFVEDEVHQLGVGAGFAERAWRRFWGSPRETGSAVGAVW